MVKISEFNIESLFFSFLRAALFSNAKIICWGSNSNGQLGLAFDAPNFGESDELRQAAFLAFSDTLGAVQLALGDEHACAVFVNAKVRCWGANDAGQLGDATLVDRGSFLTHPLAEATFAVFAPSIDPIPVVAVSAAAYPSSATIDLDFLIAHMLFYFLFLSANTNSLPIFFFFSSFIKEF